MYEFGKTTTKTVPACSLPNCIAEAGYSTCEICSASFCDVHVRENIRRVALSFSVSDAYDAATARTLPSPYGVYLCCECQVKPSGAVLVDAYRRAETALRFAGESRALLLKTANAKPGAEPNTPDGQ